MKPFYLLLVVTMTAFTTLCAQSEDCNCTISRINNQNVYSAGCNEPAEICSLTLGAGLNSISLLQFTDLRAITINIGQNTNPTFIGTAFTNNTTVFNTNGGGINIAVLDEFGGRITYSSGAGNNPNGVNALNNQLASCPGSGTCTLLMPASLPVELREWTVTRNTKSVNLRWSTDVEVASDYFRVLHSSNGLDFTEIAQIPTYGTAHEYALDHDQPANGTNYYRLEQYDTDGTRAQFGIRTIQWDDKYAATAAYPNPAVAGQIVNLPGLDENTQVELLNATGRVIQRSENSTGSINLSPTLLPGMYLLRTGGQVQRLIVR